jgi:hypothetical protein
LRLYVRVAHEPEGSIDCVPALGHACRTLSEEAPPGSAGPERQLPWQLPPPPPGYWAGYPPATGNQAIAALVCAVIALPAGLFCCGIPGITLGLVGFFLGRNAEKRIRQSQGHLTGAGLARGASITGVAAAVVSALYLLALVAVVAFMFAAFWHGSLSPSPT